MQFADERQLKIGGSERAFVRQTRSHVWKLIKKVQSLGTREFVGNHLPCKRTFVIEPNPEIFAGRHEHFAEASIRLANYSKLNIPVVSELIGMRFERCKHCGNWCIDNLLRLVVP
ncbi:MAG: hypothetical protein IPG56_15050 [Caulobacteraceae bacterium]|nr:hypothetical protein [Caulobacteraceae bacterium]